MRPGAPVKVLALPRFTRKGKITEKRKGEEDGRREQADLSSVTEESKALRSSFLIERFITCTKYCITIVRLYLVGPRKGKERREKKRKEKKRKEKKKDIFPLKMDYWIRN